MSRSLLCCRAISLLSCVSGALGDDLARRGQDPAGLEIRALVPVNLRRRTDDGSLGNWFGLVPLLLPLGIANPLARLYEVHQRMEALKQSKEPVVTLGLLAALGNAPQAVQDKILDLLLSRASAVMTNVPGPQQSLYLAGSELKQIMFWVPRPHDIGMGVSILSFNGQVQFGLITDAALVPDPQSIVARFKPEFEQLLYFVLLEPWEPAKAGSAEPAVRKVAGASRTTRARQRTRTKPASRRGRVAR